MLLSKEETDKIIKVLMENNYLVAITKKQNHVCLLTLKGLPRQNLYLSHDIKLVLFP